MGLLAAVAYYARATEGKPDPNTLYRYGTASGSIVSYAVILGLVLALASIRRDWLGLVVPRSGLGRALGLALAVFVGIFAFEFLYTAIVHAGNEQGLTPSRWRPDRAWQYVANGIVICTLVPFVEELTYRGIGYAALERLGRWPAILLVGLAFGLAHGLVLSLPILIGFGCGLAWLRARTGSVYPGMLVHACFNALALVVAVTIGG